MTTNIERAAEVLRDDKHYKMGPHGEQFLTSEAARSLADAGLLRPDLPEPNSTLDDYPEWLLKTGFKNISVGMVDADGLHITLDRLCDDMETVLDSAQYRVSGARAIAHALLAAADHAEQEQETND